MATLARHCRETLRHPFHNFSRRLRTAGGLSLVRYHGNDHHRHDDDGHSLYAQHLTTRGLVEISGPDSREFLQGLITSDTTRFGTEEDAEPAAALYAGMLNPQGRLLYDLLLYNIDRNTYWAECDEESVDNLMTTLKRHRLRRKIGIENMTEGMKIWSLFRDITETDIEEPDFIDQKFNLAFAPDPRVRSFGWRLILPEHTRMENTVRNAHELVDEDLYTLARYRIGVAEGVKELLPGKAFPLESNFDFLNGVSFTKGCYVGQELTARTHHTGVTRKRLMPVKFDGSRPVAIGDKVKNDKDRDVGTIRAVHGNYGLALLRIGNLTGRAVRIRGSDNESEAVISLPQWWPLGDKELKKVGFSLTRDKV